MVKLFVGESEFELLGEIEEIGFGEIYDIEVSINGGDKQVVIPPKNAAFIRFLRGNPHIHIDRAIIHDGEVASIEWMVKLKSSRFARRKHRF